MLAWSCTSWGAVCPPPPPTPGAVPCVGAQAPSPGAWGLWLSEPPCLGVAVHPLPLCSTLWTLGKAIVRAAALAWFPLRPFRLLLQMLRVPLSPSVLGPRGIQREVVPGGCWWGTPLLLLLLQSRSRRAPSSATDKFMEELTEAEGWGACWGCHGDLPPHLFSGLHSTDSDTCTEHHILHLRRAQSLG